MSRGAPIRYSAAEMAWLEVNRLLPIGEYHRAFCEAFRRTTVAAANLHALRKRKGWRTGRTGQFAKGAVPVNKGRRCPDGTGGRHPNAVRTHFRPGARTGRAAKLYKPIGAERLSKGGYLERKIHDGLPLQSRWRAVHLIRWEAANGPVPDGHCLKCLDGQRANTDPANWLPIPRGLLPRLNGGPAKSFMAYDEASPEVRPALLSIARLDHRARASRKAAARTTESAS
ncbi:MAG TPA: hypothetical protein VGG29_20760 [Caulobacteraceae bacterium]|jgi:hypothetical protein